MSNHHTDGQEIFSRFTERWPEIGDRLFSTGRDSFLAEQADERNYRLLRGYKLAGDILIQNALEHPEDSNNLIFPALFSYRHYIELALKAIIDAHGSFAGVFLGQKNHKLPDLWKKFMKIAASFGNDCSDPAAIAVGACIDEFAAVDANATSFRYDCNVSGVAPVLPRDGIDLMRLHDVMNGIENFFECAELDFSEKAEFATEYECI